MKKLWTTEEVYTADRCKKPICVRWAKKNNVPKFGRDYIWDAEHAKAFFKRNKKRGRPKV